MILYSCEVLLPSLSSAARAGFEVEQGDSVKLYNYEGGPGRIFGLDVIGEVGHIDFYTFCVELRENIQIERAYNVLSVGLQTNRRGLFMGPQTAWLYTQFLDQNSDNLTGFDVDTPTREHANAFQLGIWKGMLKADSSPG